MLLQISSCFSRKKHYVTLVSKQSTLKINKFQQSKTHFGLLTKVIIVPIPSFTKLQISQHFKIIKMLARDQELVDSLLGVTPFRIIQIITASLQCNIRIEKCDRNISYAKSIKMICFQSIFNLDLCNNDTNHIKETISCERFCSMQKSVQYQGMYTHLDLFMYFSWTNMFPSMMPRASYNHEIFQFKMHAS